MLFEEPWQPGTSARGGVAADAGIDDQGLDFFLRHALFHERHPAASPFEAILCTERVTDDQHRGYGARIVLGLCPGKP